MPVRPTKRTRYRAVASSIACAVGLGFLVPVASADSAGCSTQDSKGVGGPRLELEEAVKRADIDDVRTLLAAGADPNDRGLLQRTALHYAARLALVEIAQLLIDQGADVNASDSDGYTPLHRAVQSGNSTIVTTLITAGAAANATTHAGDTPGSLARENGFDEIAQQLGVEDDKER